MFGKEVGSVERVGLVADASGEVQYSIDMPYDENNIHFPGSSAGQGCMVKVERSRPWSLPHLVGAAATMRPITTSQI